MTAPVDLIDPVMLALTGVLALRWAGLGVAALAEAITRRQDPWGVPPPEDPRWTPVAVLIPAFQEEAVLAGTVRTVLRSDHPHLEVVVIDDGSADGTLEVARSLAAEDPRVRVVAQRPNGGKAAALCAGMEACSAPVLVTVDADTLLAPDAVRHLVAPLLRPEVDAVAGNVKVGNRRRWLCRWQSLEYVTELHLARRAQAFLGIITTIPGAAGAFRREAVARAGGWTGDTVTEDTDLTLALLRQGSRVAFAPGARAYTEAPETLSGLLRQRTRWLRGFHQCLWKHRRAFLRLDAVGLLAMPNLLLVHGLVFLLVPAYLSWLFHLTGMGVQVVPAILAMIGLDLAVAAVACAVDREGLGDLVHAPAWRLGWPLLMTVVFVRVVADELGRVGAGWGRVERRGELARSVAEGATPTVLRGPGPS